MQSGRVSRSTENVAEKRSTRARPQRANVAVAAPAEGNAAKWERYSKAAFVVFPLETTQFGSAPSTTDRWDVFPKRMRISGVYENCFSDGFHRAQFAPE